MYAETKVANRPDDPAPGVPEAVSGDQVRFTVLGPLEVVKDGTDHAPTTPKVLQLLAMLVLHPGKVVHIDSIIQELWAGDPPRSVRPTMHTYVYHLRRYVREIGLTNDSETVLLTKPPGYLLRIDPAQVDVFTFQQHCHQGRELLRQCRYSEAARCFQLAMGLWSGAPLANVQCGPMLSACVVDLIEQRRSAQHLRIEAEIAGGMHRELIGELRSLVAANPLDEGLNGQLMRVLGRSGRRSDAMASFRQLRNRLHAELGVEPCDELQLLHHELLSEGEKTA
ncbi:AfsR/SARP family transcriptional regulator [Amycolatopsis sp. H20-H5]|uniref:AfsR/SARP family transcriptional regulator n=1 Tax=Amycolatopsis sp. H20-H5 TaxID=3046309 RepID=UPI002DB5E00E|nr:AfsR/SARP family transcriptional regulator [Amycolatopsis sp. H20-H5]MEC3976923.1 AfsR/SARP family transcriptional regulator [Amycolatopsis sp. H20-H5]